jgi:hypothetical protein
MGPLNRLVLFAAFVVVATFLALNNVGGLRNGWLSILGGMDWQMVGRVVRTIASTCRVFW